MSKKIAEVLERLAALEAVIGIGHNGGPQFTLEDDEPPPPKSKRSGSSGLLPDRAVAARYGVSVRTLARWDETSDLNFPPPIVIRGRRYRAPDALERWDLANARRVASPSPQRRAVAEALPRARAGRFDKPAKPADLGAQALKSHGAIK